jgi:hypothetical protein
MQARSTGSHWRAAAAGCVASVLGVALGTMHYAQLAGTESLCWSVLGAALVLFALASGIMGGLGLGAATAIAVRSAGGVRRVGPGRMIAAGTIGGLAGLVVPGIVGIAGFGSLPAPYAGTGNLVFCLLVASTAFVSLWAPVLWRIDAARPIAWGEHFGLSALAASLAIASIGILVATLCAALGMVPTIDWLAAVALAIGLLPLAALASGVLAILLGSAMGFACWLYLRAAIVIDPRA